MPAIAIHQPNYLPWPGYFFKIAAVDTFVILDNVSLQIGNAASITHRTRIKSQGGATWLSVPVNHHSGCLISETPIDQLQPWKRKHIRSLEYAYRKAPYFDLYFDELSSIIMQPFSTLAELNISLIAQCCTWLDIKTPGILASGLGISGYQKSELLVEICRKLGADSYLSGNGARKYNDQELFETNGISLIYSSFTPKTYPQQFGSFIPGLSIVDVLFNLGSQSREFIRHG